MNSQHHDTRYKLVNTGIVGAYEYTLRKITQDNLSTIMNQTNINNNNDNYTNSNIQNIFERCANYVLEYENLLKRLDINSKSLGEIVKDSLYPEYNEKKNKNSNNKRPDIIEKYEKSNINSNFESKELKENTILNNLNESSNLNTPNYTKLEIKDINNNKTNNINNNTCNNNNKFSNEFNYNSIKYNSKEEELLINELKEKSVKEYIEERNLDNNIFLSSSETLKKLIKNKNDRNYIESKTNYNYNPLINNKEYSLDSYNEGNLLLKNRLGLQEKITAATKRGDLYNDITNLNDRLRRCIKSVETTSKVLNDN